MGGGLQARRDGAPLLGAVQGTRSRPSGAPAPCSSRTRFFAIKPELKPLQPSSFELPSLPAESPPWVGRGPHSSARRRCLGRVLVARLARFWYGFGVGRSARDGAGLAGLWALRAVPACSAAEPPSPRSCPRARTAPWAPCAPGSASEAPGPGLQPHGGPHPPVLRGRRREGRSQDARRGPRREARPFCEHPALLEAP